MRRILTLVVVLLAAVILRPGISAAEDYVIDTKNNHAFIEFKISHLGFSWVLGRFNTFEGTFTYDENAPEKSSVKVTIDTASVDTNHAERDKHLRSDDFLDVKKCPKATFVSRSVELTGGGGMLIKGDFTLHGVTREVTIKARHIGAGDDPWGGFRRGFDGSTTLVLDDYKIKKSLGPTAKEVQLFFTFEGIRQ